jgi:hypothetical protein
MANWEDLLGGEEIQFDGFEGTSYGDLTVLGWNGKYGNDKKYIVSCSVCRQDPELHGSGLFAMSKGHLNRGCIPCGCAEKPNWTEDQYKVRVSRACIERGLIFRGWHGEYTTANKTKVRAECPDHGDFWSMTISFFLIKDGYKGCAGCFALRMGDYKRKDDSVMIKMFMDTGCYADGTVFTRSERVDKHGHKKYWYMDCPDCGESGEGHLVGLYKGARSCACSGNRQQETYINLLMDKEDVIAIKFGIANLSTERIKRQNQLSIYDVVNYGVWTYPTVKDCRDAERYCLNNLTTKVITKEEMPDGYTETTFPSNLEPVIHIFEEYGGVRNI